MRCSEFRDQHCAFVDDTLAGVELVRMQCHVSECPECAALDARIRRSLMVARSLPPVEPSPTFRARFEARLQASKTQSEAAICSNFKLAATVGAAASLIMLGYMGYMASSLHQVEVARDLVLPPVVAMAQPPQQGEQAAEPLSGPLPRSPSETDAAPQVQAIIASVSAGMPIWPATLFAEQVPLHFASYREASQGAGQVH